MARAPLAHRWRHRWRSVGSVRAPHRSAQSSDVADRSSRSGRCLRASAPMALADSACAVHGHRSKIDVACIAAYAAGCLDSNGGRDARLEGRFENCSCTAEGRPENDCESCCHERVLGSIDYLPTTPCRSAQAESGRSPSVGSFQNAPRRVFLSWPPHGVKLALSDGSYEAESDEPTDGAGRSAYDQTLIEDRR